MNEKQRQGKTNRNKGARYERELANILKEYGYPVRRGYVFQRESDVIGLPGVHIECKAVDRLNIRTAYRQAVDEAHKRNDGVPVVFHHKNRQGWLVTLSLADFMDMYGGWNDTERDGAQAHEGNGFDQ